MSNVLTEREVLPDSHPVPPASPLLASAPGSRKSLLPQPCCQSRTAYPILGPSQHDLHPHPPPEGWQSGLYSAPVSQGLALGQPLSAWALGGQGARETTRGFLQGGRRESRSPPGAPVPALAAALSQASAHSGVSPAATCAPCPASLLQTPHHPSVSGPRAAQ